MKLMRCDKGHYYDAEKYISCPYCSMDRRMFRIIRNDITKMETDAIVNTANTHPAVGPGCDRAVYAAAGYDELLRYRKEKIGEVPEGQAFITPGFHLKARYIIHAVSPFYRNGQEGEEEKLRSCYRNSLRLAEEYHLRSIALPLISTGGFGYPKEEGMRIAVDEINAFLLSHDMQVYLVVFDDKAASLGGRIFPGLEEYIDRNYVENAYFKEYGGSPRRSRRRNEPFPPEEEGLTQAFMIQSPARHKEEDETTTQAYLGRSSAPWTQEKKEGSTEAFLDFEGLHESKLEERMEHISDTFSQYLMYMIREKNMENAEVYKRAIVDKKIFSKIKNDENYHPKKLTALCLCVGAKLNLDESKDLLARAGYALSPCDKTDIIFSYFIENGIYDMIELDIQLEEHGLPCIIS